VLLILRRVFLQGCNLIFKHEQLEAGGSGLAGAAVSVYNFLPGWECSSFDFVEYRSGPVSQTTKKKEHLQYFFRPT
jgi:hypothetical protein